MKNLYDNISISPLSLHRAVGIDETKRSIKVHNFFVRNFNKFLYKIGFFQKLIDSGFKRGWFQRFNYYWTNSLGGRPLYFHDFFFLYSTYRIKFQYLELEKHQEKDAGEFLNVWQKDVNIYSVFYYVYKYALNSFSYFPFRKYVKNGDNILEYGCGIAPIITSLIENGYRCNFTAADIQSYIFHYAKYNLLNNNVEFVDIIPNELPKVEKEFNVVFLLAVLEHLPNPMETVCFLSGKIKKNGYLIFDYILSSGDGLDTEKSVSERNQVIKYLGENYILVKGSLDSTKSISRTILKKR